MWNIINAVGAVLLIIYLAIIIESIIKDFTKSESEKLLDKKVDFLKNIFLRK